VGWKIGARIPEVQAMIGDEPVIGYLTSATLLPPGGTYRAAPGADLCAETELVVDVGPGGAIAGLGVGLELVDVARPPHGMEAIVEAHAFHRAYVLGPPRPEGVPGEASLTINDEVCQTAPVRYDPLAVLRTVARLLDAAGERIEPGDRILAGSVNHVAVASGDHVVVEIDGLGRLDVQVA
jgi:2-keto-4-pentenoate hydratase